MSIMCNVQCNKFTNRSYVNCYFGAVPCQFLYDSGAEISILSQSIFRKIPPSLRPLKLPVKIQATSATGSRLSITGCYLLQVSILGRKINHPFFVVKNLKSNQGILGMDFINKHGLSFDAIAKTAYFGTLNPKGATLDKSHKALLAKEVYLQGQSKTLASINTESNGLLALSIGVEHCPQVFRNDVLINVIDNKAKVYLTNASTLPLKIPRGTPVGIIEQVDEKELFPWQNVSSPTNASSSTTNPLPTTNSKPIKPLSEARRKTIIEKVQLNHLDADEKAKYLQLLFDYHDTLSTSRASCTCILQ